MNCRNASQQLLVKCLCAEQDRFDSFTVINHTYQDIGSEPTLVIEAQAEAIADPLIPEEPLPIKQVPIFARPRLGKGFGKANQRAGEARGCR
jgi:hypothetical protein